MKNKKFTTVMLCRAGIIAALYAVLTWVLGAVAYGPFQIRPAEALTILPLFYIEAVPGLYIGCMLANLMSGYGLYDIFLGSLATLIAGVLTYLTGRLIKNNIAKVIIGGIFPVVVNAFLVPAVWILAGMENVVYWYEFAVMILNEGIWVYVIGIPLYFTINTLIGKGVRVLQPKRPLNAA
jgi:uncharacterized membrane protein